MKLNNQSPCDTFPTVQLSQAALSCLLFSPELYNYVLEQSPSYLMLQSKKAQFSLLRQVCHKFIRTNEHAVNLASKKATHLDAEMLKFIDSCPHSYGLATNVDSSRNSMSSVDELI